MRRLQLLAVSLAVLSMHVHPDIHQQHIIFALTGQFSLLQSFGFGFTVRPVASRDELFLPDRRLRNHIRLVLLLVVPAFVVSWNWSIGGVNFEGSIKFISTIFGG